MARQSINAKEIITDIRSGMDVFALSDKYHLTGTGLQSLFKKLVDSGAIEQSELDRRFPKTVINLTQ